MSDRQVMITELTGYACAPTNLREHFRISED